MRHDVVFRLTAWYAAVFTVTSLVAGGLIYAMLVSNFHARMDDALRNEAHEIAEIYAADGLAAVQEDIVREAVSEGIGTMFVRLIARDGKELATTDRSPWRNFGIEDLPLDTPPGVSRVRTLTDAQTGRRARVILMGVDRQVVLQMGEALDEDDRILREIRQLIAVALPALVILAGLGGWFMARRALSGVEAVTRTAHAIILGDMTRRVPVTGRGDEIDRLAATFNEMLDRIQALVRGMREVNDNIAHDLRSPITRMRAAAELASSAGGGDSACQSLPADMVDECDRLLAMINTMLDISETEAGVAKFNMEVFDLGRLVREGCELFSAAMEDKGIELKEEIPAAPCLVKGDVRWLQRSVGNLLDNAAKYTPAGGRVSVTVRADGEQMHTLVEDTGPGIAPEDLPRIFERFYRGDTSRSQRGSGLGLSLALAVVRAHGGDIRVTSEAGAGSRFTVVLPRVSSSS